MRQTTLKSQAEDVQAGFDVLRVLADSVDDKLAFYIQNKTLFGPYSELVRSHAMNIQTLLGVLNDYIWTMEKTQTDVIRHIIRAREQGELKENATD